MAKQLKMAFSDREVETLSMAYSEVLRRRKADPKDRGLALDIDLALRLEVADAVNHRWFYDSVLTVPWVLPVIRKALQASQRLPIVEQELKNAQAEVKRLRAPAPKPKPRPKPRKPATVPADARTAARSGAASAAATGSAKTTHAPTVPPAAAAGGSVLPVPLPATAPR